TGCLTQVQTFTLQNRNDPVSDVTQLAGVEFVAANGGGAFCFSRVFAL
ncbi:MAG: hypothetical protein FD172_3833, partial [Methylocystaceae bacterium]